MEAIIPARPGAVHRSALKYSGEEESDKIAHIETDDDEHGGTEWTLWEDAEVEAEDGDFGRGDDEEVYDLVPPVELFIRVRRVNFLGLSPDLR